MTEIDPLKIPAFMRRRRPLKDTSFQPTPKFKINRSTKSALKFPEGFGMTRLNKPKVSLPVFDAPLMPEVQAPSLFQPQPTTLPVGIVTHYYDQIKVAVLKLSADVEKGVKVQLMSEKGVFTQKINSMQIDRIDVPHAPKGAEIGIKVKRKVILGEIAYLIP